MPNDSGDATDGAERPRQTIRPFPSPAVPDPLRDQLQTALGTAYTLERELGGGGMSRVFVAEETRFRRRVVIKVLPPELAAGLSGERFELEIALAAGLQEPHIVPVHAAGVTAEGLPYYTMPYVDGESLRARLGRGPVPLGEAVSILRDLARALGYAHAHGVVHRDIKPENVLLSSGTAVVTDFGIAKAVSAARTMAASMHHGVTGRGLTQAGMSLGTPGYMSPEQVAGDEVDHRADLYSWGVVAYELLAGAHSFAGKVTAQQLLVAQISETPRPLATVAPGVPSALAGLVMQCLEKTPSGRPASAAELLSRLPGPELAKPPGAGRRRWVGAAVVVVLVVVGGYAWTRARRAAPGDSVVADGVPRVAVLPFEHIGRPEDAYVTEGLAEEVRARLATLPSLAVIARASTILYRGTTKSPTEVARELGASYLLTATVRAVPASDGRAARVRVQPELVRVSRAGGVVRQWGDTLTGDVADLLRMQADIATRVAEGMTGALAAGVRTQLARVPEVNPVAYDHYLRGVAAANDWRDGQVPAHRRAVPELEQAVAADSTFVTAWAALAEATSGLHWFGVQSRASAERARAAAERALALAPQTADVQRAWCVYQRQVRSDVAAAIAACETAYRLAPGDSRNVGVLAFTEARGGRLEASVRHYRTTMMLNPRSAGSAAGFGQTLLYLRRTGEARAVLDRAIELDPTSQTARMWRMMTDLQRGDLVTARAVLAAAPPTMRRDVLAARIAGVWAMGWALDTADQRLLLTLGPDAWNGDRAARAEIRMLLLRVRGDTAASRAEADTAVRVHSEQLAGMPPGQDAELARAGIGYALAYTGRRADVSAYVESPVRAFPTSTDVEGGGLLQYARAVAYAVNGEGDRSLAVLEEILREPSNITAGWLRIDPSFMLLRGDPRFRRLAQLDR